jgi:hypothetical protein
MSEEKPPQPNFQLQIVNAFDILRIASEFLANLRIVLLEHLVRPKKFNEHQIDGLVEAVQSIFNPNDCGQGLENAADILSMRQLFHRQTAVTGAAESDVRRRRAMEGAEEKFPTESIVFSRVFESYSVCLYFIFYNHCVPELREAMQAQVADPEDAEATGVKLPRELVSAPIEFLLNKTSFDSADVGAATIQLSAAVHKVLLPAIEGLGINRAEFLGMLVGLPAKTRTTLPSASGESSIQLC